MSLTLPPGFESLAGFGEWALSTERERFDKRIASRMEQLQAFYDAVLPHMQGVIEHLKDYDLDRDVPEPTWNLYLLGLSFMDVSISVERFGEPDESDVFEADRYFVKGPQDLIVALRQP